MRPISILLIIDIFEKTVPPELRLLAKKVIHRKPPIRLNLLSVKCRTFIQENRAAQNVILSQIL